MTDLSLAVAEKAAFVCALEAKQGDLTLAAIALGIGRSTIYRKIIQYDLQGFVLEQRAKRGAS